VEERYYKRKYITSEDGGDFVFLVHSNKLCVIKLAPTHPIIADNMRVKAINFQVSDTLNRLDNQVKGKGKKGAQMLTNSSVLCQIECENRESPFILRASMIAKLLEVNTTLVQDPERIKANHLNYIAIITPRISDHEKQLSSLLDEEQFHQQKSEGSR